MTDQPGDAITFLRRIATGDLTLRQARELLDHHRIQMTAEEHDRRVAAINSRPGRELVQDLARDAHDSLERHRIEMTSVRCGDYLVIVSRGARADWLWDRLRLGEGTAEVQGG